MTFFYFNDDSTSKIAKTLNIDILMFLTSRNRFDNARSLIFQHDYHCPIFYIFHSQHDFDFSWPVIRLSLFRCYFCILVHLSG